MKVGNVSDLSAGKSPDNRHYKERRRMDNLITIQRAQPAPPCTVVIFGASGDLAKRKLIPSLYNLVACGEGHDAAEKRGARICAARDVDR